MSEEKPSDAIVRHGQPRDAIAKPIQADPRCAGIAPDETNALELLGDDAGDTVDNIYDALTREGAQPSSLVGKFIPQYLYAVVAADFDALVQSTRDLLPSLKVPVPGLVAMVENVIRNKIAAFILHNIHYMKLASLIVGNERLVLKVLNARLESGEDAEGPHESLQSLAEETHVLGGGILAIDSRLNQLGIQFSKLFLQEVGPEIKRGSAPERLKWLDDGRIELRTKEHLRHPSNTSFWRLLINKLKELGLEELLSVVDEKFKQGEKDGDDFVYYFKITSSSGGFKPWLLRPKQPK